VLRSDEFGGADSDFAIGSELSAPAGSNLLSAQCFGDIHLVVRNHTKQGRAKTAGSRSR